MSSKSKVKLQKRFSKNSIEAGCDEAGRGCLAGPVFAAAVILPDGFEHPLLNDSKKISEKNRAILRPFIEAHALAWAVGVCSPEEIDEINILNASFLAMHKAIDQLQVRPELLLIDGNRFKAYSDVPFECIIKGDGKFTSIAAASVLAKTHRDAYMQRIHQDYPHYKWDSNAGYPTKAHREAIEAHGPCEHHRKSFTLLKGQQLELSI
jgi:ribonuclease HII